MIEALLKATDQAIVDDGFILKGLELGPLHVGERFEQPPRVTAAASVVGLLRPAPGQHGVASL